MRSLLYPEEEPMPAMTNPLPVPTRPAEPAPARPAPESRKPRRWLLLSLLASMALLAGWLAYRLLTARPQTADTSAGIRAVKVTSGPFERTFRLTGQTAAVRFASVTVPIMRSPDSRREMVLMYVAKSGSLVKKGDVIAQIDAQTLVDHIEDVNSTIAQSEADIKKRRAEQAVDWENLQQTLREAKAEYEKARLDDSAIEVRTVIDQELSKLWVEETAARYRQLQEDLASMRTVHEAELKVLDITRRRHIRHRNFHAGDLNKFTFRAPMDGLVVMETIFRAGEIAQIQQGDQISPGQSIMKIVDTSSMQLEADVNQTESGQLRVGQKATVRLDAFPGVAFPAHVQTIGAMGVRGWRENYYIRRVPVRVAIESSDPRLIPDLSGSADVLVERRESATLVPLEAVQAADGRHTAWVRNGDRLETRVIRLGPQNATHAVVLAGIEAGQEVGLEPPPAR